MALELGDLVLITGIVVCLVLFYLEIGIITKQKAVRRYFTTVKFLAILGILFFATALVAGAAITSYATKEVVEENVANISDGLDQNSLTTIELEKTIAELKKTIVQSSPSESSKDISDREELLAYIDYLESKLKNQKRTNQDLEDEIDDIQDELEDIYALLPSGNY